ncbi:MAG: hypothetical protein IJR87_05700 [Bacteroidaceae bacterium]|nr:hypothetical protein [Bacteroidaceae bacterium]
MNANDSFILRHRTDDVHRLALEPVPEGVDIKYCLQQIEGWQTAQHKLPRWADTEGIIFPPRLSMEQCSSQHTASYKCQVVERLFPELESRGLMADLTGGFGVDFSFIAPLFREAVYVEEQPSLCELARHNLPLLGLPKAKVFTPDGTPTDMDYTLIYLDPSRRNVSGRKVVALEECSPNVVPIQKRLLQQAEVVMIKLSPMLDISQALKQLDDVREVHIIGIKGECKELLFVLSSRSCTREITFYCANLETGGDPFVCSQSECKIQPQVLSPGNILISGYLHEPNACILKAGMQEVLARRFGTKKFHPMSNLYFSPNPLEGAQGLYRSFRIIACSDFGKKNLRHLIGNLKQANLTIRNFPASVTALRKKLCLAEGGENYLFATTNSMGQHILIHTLKYQKR